jgi:hypothetical protein
MGACFSTEQKPQNPLITTEQKYSTLLPILEIEKGLFLYIASFMDKHSELALAKTRKTLYTRYEKHYKGKTAVVLYDPQSKDPDYARNIKALQLHHGWPRLKYASISDSQISNCPVKILYLNGELKAPEKLDCVCVNSLIFPSLREFELNISFVEKFPNLQSLLLNQVILNDNGISTISKLSLKFICLVNCDMTFNHLVGILKNCITLQEIQLVWCNYLNRDHLQVFFDARTSPKKEIKLSTCLDIIPLNLPSQLKRFNLQGHDCYKLNATKCTQLESL